ncbi:MAG TPA: PKD domain-containing protein [Terracidiphilus sp.]
MILLALPFVAYGASRPRVVAAAVPPDTKSNAFTITVNGAPVDVAHAAANYHYVSFDFTGGPVEIEITAAEPGFWDRGVDIEPWRLGFRPVREGQTIRFSLARPAKLSISRPRDFLNHATMLFLFAGTPPDPAPSPGPNVKIYGPGVYHESITAESGQTIYLGPGSYFYGGINLWQVNHVKVLGRGTMIYDGPQDPTTDEGWMHKRDWHCVVADQAHNIEIDGLTCIVRSRTWSIQMKDTDHIVYDDLRVIGGNPGNANQDGMDWIGSSNGLVRNSFLRASDDDIALMGNWDGYTDADMVRPGNPVHDITIENSELSTSISNIVRAGWPKKIFNSWNFTLRNSDILHGGIGGCGQTFALIGFWGANGSRGDHNNYKFENLWFDNWYSLVQMEQEAPSLRSFTFRNIWALDQPPLVGSSLRGDITGTVFDNVKYGQRVAAANADVPLSTDNAQPVKYQANSGAEAEFTVEPPLIAKGTKVTFTAKPTPHGEYTWMFGDGSRASGRVVHHTYADADGTDLDGHNGAGRFRVMLRAVDSKKKEDWAAQGIVVVSHWLDAANPLGPTVAGLAFHIFPGTWTELPKLGDEHAVFEGSASNLNANARGFTRYAVAWDGFIDIPADGGYTFHLLDRDGARVVIDGIEVAKTGPPFPQVCGSPGNAVRYDRGALGLRAGKHALHVEELHQASQGPPRLLWEGPALPITDVPDAAFSQTRQDIITARQ